MFGFLPFFHPATLLHTNNALHTRWFLPWFSLCTTSSVNFPTRCFLGGWIYKTFLHWQLSVRNSEVSHKCNSVDSFRKDPVRDCLGVVALPGPLPTKRCICMPKSKKINVWTQQGQQEMPKHSLIFLENINVPDDLNVDDMPMFRIESIGILKYWNKCWAATSTPKSKKRKWSGRPSVSHWFVPFSNASIPLSCNQLHFCERPWGSDVKRSSTCPENFGKKNSWLSTNYEKTHKKKVQPLSTTKLWAQQGRTPWLEGSGHVLSGHWERMSAWGAGLQESTCWSAAGLDGLHLVAEAAIFGKQMYTHTWITQFLFAK